MPEPKRFFTQEFRDEAVRLAQTSGRSRREVASDLGIGLSTLRNWIDRRAKRAGLAAVAAHSADQPVKAPAHDLCRCTISVAEDVRGGMDPAIGALDVGPQMRGALKPASDQSLELGEPRRERAAPFCATRSKLLASFSNRCSSFSPAAASGVRPSSVIAERTAAP